MKSLTLAFMPLVLMGCPSDPDGPPGTPEPISYSEADALRVSMALRGHRPSVAELDQVAADGTILPSLVDTWMTEPSFGETIRHLHADTFLTRTNDSVLPQLGPLLNTPRTAINRSLTEEPLALIEHVVLNDQPYTQIVTADYTVIDEVNALIFASQDRTAGDGEQVAYFTDNRPAGGILSTDGLWVRHVSNGSNFHRARANMVSDKLLCTDFLTRDIPLSGDIDLSDEAAVAQALTTQTECIACHQTLDPLGAHFWTMRNRTAPFQVANSYDREGNCIGRECYPLTMYDERRAIGWQRVGLQPPSYFGYESDDMGVLGAQIADDPRFAQCAVQRFYSYFSQTERADIPFEDIAALQADFVASDFDAKALIKSIVLNPEFADVDHEDGPGLLSTRPFQYAKTLEELTGFRMAFNVDNNVCRTRGINCTGDLDVVYNDQIGFRSMAGGIDGVQILKPTWTTTPTKVLVAAALAEEAASTVVDHDFSNPPRLLKAVTSDTTDEAAIRSQLVELHRQFYAISLDSDDPEITEAYTLFEAERARQGGPGATATAWKVTIAALLQDPRFLFY